MTCLAPLKNTRSEKNIAENIIWHAFTKKGVKDTNEFLFFFNISAESSNLASIQIQMVIELPVKIMIGFSQNG